MKRWLYIGIPLVLLALGSVLFYQFVWSAPPEQADRKLEDKADTAGSGMDSEDEKGQKNVSGEKSGSPEAASAVRKAHDVINGLVGWGRSGSFHFSKNEEKLQTILAQIASASEDAGDTVKRDLENAKKAIEKAQKNEDVKGVLVAHRILHDLDGHLNDDPLDGKIWGYTETVSEDAKKALKYLQ